MKLPIAGSFAFIAMVLAPAAHADAPAARPTAAPKPPAHPSATQARPAPPPARTTHPPTALHSQPHSKNPTPPVLHLPQLPPPDAHPATPPVAPPPPAADPKAEPKLDPKGALQGAHPATAANATPPKPPCLKTPVAITRGIEEDRFSLGKCDGSAAPEAVEHLSILARAGDALKPSTPIAQLVKVQGDVVAPGIRRLDARLVERLQIVVDHFVKNAQTQKLHVISGYRPTSAGSFHATARALDFRIDGVTNESLVAFCKTIGDTGCGYYPNSSFIHMDVREPGTGHVAWIDASGPGEAPRYVATWPPPKLPDVVPQMDAGASLFLSLFGKDALPAGEDETPADPKTASNTPLPPPPAAPSLLTVP